MRPSLSQRIFHRSQVMRALVPAPTVAWDLTTSLPSAITFTRASGGTRINSSGVLVTETTNTPRFDYDPVTIAAKGLLIEEQRTNVIRNNTMVGAVAGTPGTLPTNWSIAGGSTAGLSTQVVGTGTENGVSYIDYRLFGTTTSTAVQIWLEAASTIASVAADVWDCSTYMTYVGGSLSNVGQAQIGILVTGGTGSISSSYTLQSGNLLSKRYDLSTTTGTGTTFVRPYFVLNFTNGAAVDITVRVGLPQLEKGSFATSAIPTSGAQATRAADVAVVTGTNFSSWYNQSEGTIYAEVSDFNSVTTTTGRFIEVANSATSGNDRMVIGKQGSAQQSRFVVLSSGVAQSDIYVAISSPAKMAGAYKLNSFNQATNGTLGIEDTSGVLPSGVNAMYLGADYLGAAGTYLNGHIKSFKYWNTRLTNAQLQKVTA